VKRNAVPEGILPLSVSRSAMVAEDVEGGKGRRTENAEVGGTGMDCLRDVCPPPRELLGAGQRVQWARGLEIGRARALNPLARVWAGVTAAKFPMRIIHLSAGGLAACLAWQSVKARTGNRSSLERTPFNHAWPSSNHSAGEASIVAGRGSNGRQACCGACRACG
jgi:hypothetical protein